MNKFSTFLQLQKVDISKREVWGTAAIEQPDRAREIMDYEKSLTNFLNWSRDMAKASGGLSQGNVRAMHGDIAAGKLIHFEPRDDTKSIYVGAKIVDDNEWKKVLEGVYTGFSVGGSYGKKWPDPTLPGFTRYEAKPVEISLVDVPCMPGAQFEVVKADGSSEMRKLYSADSMESDEQGKSVGIADLIKGAGMQTNELLEKMNASSDPAMQELATELKKAFPPAKEKEDEESATADDKKQDKPNPFDKSKKEDAAAEGETKEHEESETPEEEAQEDATGEESEEQTANTPDPAQTEAVRAVVIQLLEELGFVQEQGGQPGAPTAMKFVTVENLQKRMADREDELKKAYDAVSARQTEITSDLVKLSTTVDEMEKRGGPAPILRDLGSLTPELAGAMQKAAALRDVIAKTTDPIVEQALRNELTVLEIKNTKPIQ